MSELTEEAMQKPFLTYEQFMAEKERLMESAVDDALQRENISEIQEPDREDGLFRVEIPDKAALQAEVSNDIIVQAEQPKLSDYAIIQMDIPDFSVSTVPNAVSDPEVPGISVQKETVSRTQDSLQNAESSLESPAEKTVTKQDYQRMTDKEKAEWIGISLSDMPGSIRRFKSKMEQLGIWHESTIEMTDAFMKLWNQAEKERDIPQNRGDYQRVLRR